jgi:Family of unknown function (DUF5675)
MDNRPTTQVALLRYHKHSDLTTYSDLHVYFGDKHIYHCKAMELGWRDNKIQVSRIPAGRYLMKLEYSPAFKRKLYELKLVPGRGEIKIHVANYYQELKGCIALGTGKNDINKDGVDDMTQSTDAFDGFMKVMYNTPMAWITIVDLF